MDNIDKIILSKLKGVVEELEGLVELLEERVNEGDENYYKSLEQ